MSGRMPNRIKLPSTSAVSLNDRFTTLQRSASNTQQVRLNMQQQQQASLKNRRLAEQMANRPGVQRAMQPQPRNIQQRLGVQARITSPSPRGRGMIRGAVGGRIFRGSSQRGFAVRGFAARGFPGRGFARGYARGGYTVRGTRARGSPQYFRGAAMRNARGRGGFRGGAYRGGFSARGDGLPRGRGMRGAARGGRGFRGGRGRGRGNQATTPVTKDALDSELDQYMSTTKSVLDNELDAYRSQQD